MVDLAGSVDDPSLPTDLSYKKKSIWKVSASETHVGFVVALKIHKTKIVNSYDEYDSIIMH